ncbi:DUF4405 domain-containing protein [Lachnospiraceae bacterium 64-25]
MAYELVGQAAHEWIGIGMFALFVIHHILNGSWIRNLLRGRYNPVRIMQTGLVLLILCAMVGLMVSGTILSRHALSFLPIKGGRSFARNLHMLSAYWGFVLMSVHLGFHWSMMMGMAKKFFPKPSAVRKWVLRILALVIAGYGGAFGVFLCNGYIHDFYGIRGGCRAGRPRSARQNKGAGGIMVCYR